MGGRDRDSADGCTRRGTHGTRSHVRLRGQVEESFCTTNTRFRLLESVDEIYTHIPHHKNICHHHYLLTSILEIKSPPNLAISAKIASLLISALTSSSPALTGTVE